MIKAPSRRAVTELLGRPSDSSGIIPPATAELFADSGPATPSIAPLPKRSGCLAVLRSRAYETKEAVTGLPPGRIPIPNPRTLPLRIAFQDCAQSVSVGSRPTILSVMVLRADDCS